MSKRMSSPIFAPDSSFPSRKWTSARAIHRLILLTWVFILSTYLYARLPSLHAHNPWQTSNSPSVAPSTAASPFSGPFAQFQRVSSLPARHRRLTVIAAWNDDKLPPYLRHFLHTIQQNADSLDLIMINRLKTPGARCIDFDSAGVNITWGGNIRLHCMPDEEWKRRHVDFFCSDRGWDCSPVEYEEVWKAYQNVEDERNVHVRPLHGYIFHDLFPNPDNPFWAWMDVDTFVGNFARYPFNLLAQLSFLTGPTNDPGVPGETEYIYMPGQLTAFNLDNEALAGAWKKFPEMLSPAHFIKNIGEVAGWREEGYWSFSYIRMETNSPGADLSYGVYPDLHGDDMYDNGVWQKRDSSQVYLISGREIILTSIYYTRTELESLILTERYEAIDDLGSIGWTGAADNPTESLLQSPRISLEARHDVIVEDQVYIDCEKKRYRQCIAPHPLTASDPPILRATLVRLKEQQPGHFYRRLDRDQRPRGYERKLIKHHLWIKRRTWFNYPPFDITNDMVFRYNNDFAEVFRMGPTREETIFARYRVDKDKNIG